MFYLYRTLERTSANQREHRTYAKRRIEGSVGVHAVVSDSNTSKLSERYQTAGAHCAPKRCQLPEHNGGDEDGLGHRSGGAKVDAISRS